MSNLQKLEFAALDLTEKNYLEWALDAETHLVSKKLGDTIKKELESSREDKAKVLIFLRHHLHERLKVEYLTVKNLQELWTNLKERYEHQKTVLLFKARYEWIHLRLQDFKIVCEYSSALFKISSQLKLCGQEVTDEDLMEKNFSTFHASNVLLQQQYHEKDFKRYSDLIGCLLLAEENNELLMKNHEVRPIGSTAFPEVNVAYREPKRNHGQNNGQNRGRGRGKWNNRVPTHNQKWNKHEKRALSNNLQNVKNVCYRCGLKGHWSRICRTPEHFVKLYQDSIKRKGQKQEVNLTIQRDAVKANGVETKLKSTDDIFADLDDIIDLSNPCKSKTNNFGYPSDVTHLDEGNLF